ncbi:Phytochrome-like protein cph1 [Acaryochloris thomasi RCC1774]|uniref:histidine kinase n=1 Tax=Acaryochloris thomasi RCC1774 TaxID=1764569 RepID=A0A2W1JB75_9CYAN|nr:ATP-binding protein [Acaryochloris thomasi]PZD71208.1 Phytochrome-like protein cph1 [Acaryochloris thomasi RCC1774]
MSVLLVDDSEVDRLTYRRYLQATVSANQIIECDCGDAALESCRSQWPSIILLDYSLPDMDGLDFFRLLGQELGSCPPIIMLTGEGSEQVAVEAMKAGAKDYLIKGQLTSEKLNQAVTQALFEHQLKAQIERQRQQRELLREVALKVMQASELSLILQAAASGGRKLLGCDRTLIYRFEPDMSGTVVAESVLPGWTAAMGCRLEDNCFQGQQGHKADKYLQGHKMVVPDVESAGLSDCHLQMLQQFQVKSNLVVPIIRADAPLNQTKLWGLLIAHHCEEKHCWQPDDLALLDELTLQVAIAIQQAELVNGLQASLEKQQAVDHQLRERAVELERTNQLLAQSTQSLSQRNQELDEFAHIVSHDLKAPLRGIANLSQWIVEDLQDQVPEENQQQLALIQNRIQRMDALIDGVLQYARAGRQTIAINMVDVRQMLLEIIDSLAPPETFEVQVPAALPCIETQALLLQQVFSNLISNALKYHDRTDGTVQILLDEQGDQLQFTVIDDGPGIAPEHHQRIFGIFQTLSTTDRTKGTGLGLTIIKKIVEQQGGSVWVESDLGQGSAFSFTWPRISS